MPHNLTESDAFTTPIVVPDGGDSRSNAAEVVQALAQALANRTKHLNDHAAFRDVANTFTLANTFDLLLTALTGIEANNNDAEIAALVVRTTADDDAHASNKYKTVLGFNIGGGHGYVNVYSGVGSSAEAQFIIALNAVWSTSAQNWVKDDAGSNAFALLFRTSGELTLSCRTAGGTWTAWPVTGPSVIRAGSGEVTSLTATGTVAADDVTATDVAVTHAVAVPTPTDADQTKGYQYSDSNWRDFMVPLFSALGGVPYLNLFADGIIAIYQPGILGVGDMVAWPLSVSAGCKIGEIQIRHVQSATVVGGNDDFVLMKRSSPTGAWSTVSTVTAAGAAGAAQTTTLNAGPSTTVLTDTEYMIRWIVHNSDVTKDVHRVQAVGLEVFDVGPRNKVN